MLTSLALIPAIAVLIYIYKKDKKEKEPTRLLLGCLLFGVIATIPMLIVEELEDSLFEGVFEQGSVIYAFVEGFIVAGLTEEFFKKVFLKKKTWNSKHFDCMFDGIVYSVFVTMGFAAFENLFYVIDGGLSTAFIRMITSIPGHTCFGIYMGYFYSKAKLAQVEGNHRKYKSYNRKALWVPVILHGIYDMLIMVEDEAVGEAVSGWFVFIWFIYVVALFIVSFSFVKFASDHDEYICMTENGKLELVKMSPVKGWRCRCGRVNAGNFCTECGAKRI